MLIQSVLLILQALWAIHQQLVIRCVLRRSHIREADILGAARATQLAHQVAAGYLLQSISWRSHTQSLSQGRLQ